MLGRHSALPLRTWGVLVLLCLKRGVCISYGLLFDSAIADIGLSMFCILNILTLAFAMTMCFDLTGIDWL